MINVDEQVLHDSSSCDLSDSPEYKNAGMQARTAFSDEV